jgi:hypothetical protein
VKAIAAWLAVSALRQMITAEALAWLKWLRQMASARA